MNCEFFKRKLPCHFVELVCLLGVRLVERFGPDLELQTFHLLDDMVLTGIDLHLLVADRVVELQVLHVEQGDDLRKLSMEELQESFDFRLLTFDFLSEHHNQHYLPLVVVPQDQRPQQSLVGVLVVETQAVYTCILAHAVPYSIIDIRHQVTLLYVQHFVERPRDMESDAGFHF